MLRLPWQRPLLATAHWTFCSNGRLEAKRANQFWWNLVCNSKLGPQWLWQSHYQILKLLKFKMADGRHVGKYLKCHNSPTNGPTVTQLGRSHPIMFSTCLPWCGCHSNSALYIQQLWASEGQMHEPILLKFGLQPQIQTTMTVTWSNIKIFKIQNGGRSLLENIRNATTRLLMDRLGRNLGGRIPLCSQYWKCYNSSYDGTVSLVLVVTTNRTINVLVLCGVEIKNIHNFDETWMTVPLWYKKIKSGRKTANINTK